MGRLYRALRDLEWMQSLAVSLIGAGSVTGFEAFWNDIPAVWKGIGYGVVLFIAMEWTRRTATRSVPAAERAPDGKASVFTPDQLFELEKLDRERKKSVTEFLKRDWGEMVIAVVASIVVLTIVGVLAYACASEV